VRPQLALALALAACGPKNSGPSRTPDKDDQPARPVLDAGEWASMFEEEQAAYYIENEGSVWLVLRLTDEADEAEVLGHVFGIIANRFDYSSDPRKNLVLIAYKGRVEDRRNYGIRVTFDALSNLQAGNITIDELTEEAGYILNGDISALKPFITK
jgi:hypothetical protein